jgi:hypothetical protein
LRAPTDGPSGGVCASSLNEAKVAFRAAWDALDITIVMHIIEQR